MVPFFLSSIFAGERPMLPMIDLPLTKQDAIPWDFWGCSTTTGSPTPSDGVTVFLQGLENRGEHNLRKRIYFTGVTPDLYAPKYQAKVVAFFDKLLDEARQQAVHAPLSRLLLGHLLGSASRREGRRRAGQIRTIGEAFNTVLAYRNPLQEIVYENYMNVRHFGRS